jgi:formylglycine-generating enzyme required for sulfatase activity
MKKLIIFSIICLGFSFKSKPKKLIPPGTVQITETFFADEAEISNLSWSEYEFYTKNKYGTNSKEHLETLPDTLVWRNKESFNEPYVKHYYRHPAYKNYPVVGISYKQVTAFCKWRTERVKEFYAMAYKKGLLIEYHLPSQEEWEFVSTNGSGVFSNHGVDKNGKPQFNHRWMTDSLSKKYYLEHDQYPDITAPVNSYEKNRFGLYCSFGNVAEMIMEEGICKGGSWQNTIEECRAGKDILYTKPTAWLGFRCVCVLQKAP